MKTVKLLSVAIVALFLTLAVWIPIASALEFPPYDGTQDADGPKQESKGAEVRVFFRGQKLTVTRATGNQSEETANCPAKAFGARMSGTIIGTWSMVIGGDVTVSGAVSIAIWARSQAGAKNAGFRVNLYRSGGNMQDFYTNRQTLTASPVKFTADGNYNQQFSTGDTFDVQLVWLSDPKYGIGPSGGGEFVFGNGQYDSSVKLNFETHPLALANISVINVNKETLDVKADFNDILGCDPVAMDFKIGIQGPVTANPSNVDKPKPASASGNVSSVSWTWHHKIDGAKSGDYMITITMSYDGNSSITNSSTVKVVLPGRGSTGGGVSIPGLDAKGGGMTMYLIIIVVIVIVVVVAIVAKRSKGKKKKPKVEEEEEDEDEDEEDED